MTWCYSRGCWQSTYGPHHPCTQLFLTAALRLCQRALSPWKKTEEKSSNFPRWDNSEMHLTLSPGEPQRGLSPNCPQKHLVHYCTPYWLSSLLFLTSLLTHQYFLGSPQKSIICIQIFVSGSLSGGTQLLWIEQCLPKRYVEVLISAPNLCTRSYLEIGSLQTKPN